ncbi:MAG TPA: hypothetical protein VN783_04435 [Thermoanaerobaculia bacterium]|nr:hypothetical protein [Thermoanaerobaculia bacterium]
MNPGTPELLTRWLQAEESVDDESAEALLAELASELPEWSPPPGFAARVMARVAREQPARGVWTFRWARASVGLGVASAGVAVAWLAPLLWLLLPRPSAAGGVRLTADLFARLGEGLAALAGWAESLGAIRRALAAPLDHPPVAASVALLAILAGCAFFLLQTLLRRERSWSYVDL